jgi:anti-sigma factor ChrR (cupin superfamily)
MDPVAGTQTSLWQIAPGGVIPPHDHIGEEECLIVEGSIVWNGHEYHPGDFLLARPGAHHEPFVSPNGALLLIRSELTRHLEKLFR